MSTEKKVGFYPGCSLDGTAGEYNLSVQSLAQAFGILLEPVPDWNCCGATAAHNLDKTLSLSLPARVLANATEAGMADILVPCAACYNRLSCTSHELQQDGKLKQEIENLLGKKINSFPRIINLIQFVQDYLIDDLPGKITKPFTAKSACYYGCLLVRPHDILKFDRPEDPQSMENIMSLIGSESIDWPFKTECCGAGLSVSRTDVVARLSGRIVAECTERGADAIIVACPMCHANLDMRRSAINQYAGVKYDIPVLYLSQVIGMALGLSEKKIGIRRHLVKVDVKNICRARSTEKSLQ